MSHTEGNGHFDNRECPRHFLAEPPAIVQAFAVEGMIARWPRVPDRHARDFAAQTIAYALTTCQSVWFRGLEQEHVPLGAVPIDWRIATPADLRTLQCGSHCFSFAPALRGTDCRSLPPLRVYGGWCRRSLASRSGRIYGDLELTMSGRYDPSLQSSKDWSIQRSSLIARGGRQLLSSRSNQWLRWWVVRYRGTQSRLADGLWWMGLGEQRLFQS